MEIKERSDRSNRIYGKKKEDIEKWMDQMGVCNNGGSMYYYLDG